MSASVLKLMGLKDSLLVRLYQLGNDNAFVVLMWRYEKPEKQYLHHKLNDAEKEKDAWHDVLLDLMIRLKEHKYYEIERFDRWLHKSVYDRVMNIYKEAKNKQQQNLDDEMADNATLSFIVNHDLLNYIMALVEKMGLKTRTIFHMRIEQDMTLDEIAKELNLHVNTVYTLFKRCVSKLQKTLPREKNF